MSRYTDDVLGHADESDGIEEYDNPLPDWWVGLFVVSTVWGIGYAVNYHLVAESSQRGFYDEEVAAAAVRWPQPEEAAGADLSPETLALGGETFAAHCLSCHGAALQGGIGPSLVDAAWIHGGDYESIARTITEGVAAKGMPQWGPILGARKVAAVASFVMDKAGANAGPSFRAGAPPVEAAPAVGDGAAAVAVAAPADGQAIFTQYCVACHGPEMTGGIGPNLIDAEWIHGGELEQIAATIANGVPAKGMISWKGTLNEAQIEAVARFVHEKSRPR